MAEISLRGNRDSGSSGVDTQILLFNVASQEMVLKMVAPTNKKPDFVTGRTSKRSLDKKEKRKIGVCQNSSEKIRFLAKKTFVSWGRFHSACTTERRRRLNIWIENGAFLGGLFVNSWGLIKNRRLISFLRLCPPRQNSLYTRLVNSVITLTTHSGFLQLGKIISEKNYLNVKPKIHKLSDGLLTLICPVGSIGRERQNNRGEKKSVAIKFDFLFRFSMGMRNKVRIKARRCLRLLEKGSSGFRHKIRKLSSTYANLTGPYLKE